MLSENTIILPRDPMVTLKKDIWFTLLHLIMRQAKNKQTKCQEMLYNYSVSWRLLWPGSPVPYPCDIQTGIWISVTN